MHEGDPRGQIRPSAEGNAGCVSCHEEITEVHSRHQVGGGGDQCVDCHMPRTVYGVLDAHRNHRIDNPNPRVAALGQRPDACTSCHVEASQRWASAELERMWGIELSGPSGVSPDASANRQRLFGGDPIERAVAADAIGRSTLVSTPEAMARRGGDLLEVIASDPYPAVRRIAARAFRRWSRQQGLTLPDRLLRFDTMLPAESRLVYIREIQASLPPARLIAPPEDELEDWRARARHVAIEIGE